MIKNIVTLNFKYYLNQYEIEAKKIPQIVVSEWTKKQLDELKAAETHTSYDSVIRSLIMKVKSIE